MFRCATRATVFGTVDLVAYTVTTPVFEGPLDLLAHLIATHEVDVLDVPLAPVVEAFVAELKERSADLTIEVLSEFLLLAAVLVELKSQRLLPGRDEVADEDELVGWEERDLLMARLLECRAYGAAADAFVALTEHAARSVPREVGFDPDFVVHAPDLLAGVTPDRLAQAYLRATAERPVPQVDLSHVTVDTVTVAGTVERLSGVLAGRPAVSFRELTADLATKMDVIVHFLAVLELCKRGKVTLGQGHTFGELRVEWVPDDRRLEAVLVGGPADDDLADEYDG
jgi:segregation and condensation protein A